MPTVTPSLASRLLASLAAAADSFETIVVDNGTGDPELDRAAASLRGAELLRLDSNLGYSRATSAALRRRWTPARGS